MVLDRALYFSTKKRSSLYKMIGGNFMILFLQCVVVAMALFVILISIKERKIPRGLIEWAFMIGAIAIMIIWAIKY